jgi:hypothetical protein
MRRYDALTQDYWHFRGNIHYCRFLAARTFASIDNEVYSPFQLLTNLLGSQGSWLAANIGAGSDYGIPQVLNESLTNRVVRNAHCYGSS